MRHSLLAASQTVEASPPSPGIIGARPSGLRHPSFLLQTLVIAGLVILFFAPTLRDLVNLWWTRYGFSHGFLVPLVSLYLIRLQWPTLRQIPVEPAIGWGSVWLVSSTALLLASEAGSVLTVGSVALILVLAGLVLLLCGAAYLKALGFPLSYLIFMTPAFDGLTEPLVWPFQLLTANMSVSILQALGIPVFLENSVFIILPTVTLEVARECSGAGLLIAVLAIGLPLASLTLQAWWSRITLVLSSVGIAIVANWVRVTIMGIYAQAGGKDLHGPYHILQGLFVDWVAFAFLFVGAWVLSSVETAFPTSTVAQEPDLPVRSTVHRADLNRAWWLACLVLVVGIAALYSFDRGTTALKKDLATFPALVGMWVVDRVPNDDVPVGIPAADHALVRTYRAPDGRRVQLSIAYINAQRQGKELVGRATAPLHERATVTELRVGAVSMPINRTVIDKRRRPVPAVFWYHVDGTSYADRVLAKAATIKQAVLRGRTDGALVLVSAESQGSQSGDEWRAQEEFAGALLPLMQEYLP